MKTIIPQSHYVWFITTYLTNQGSNKSLPEPSVTLLRYLHLLPHDLRRRHRPSQSRQRGERVEPICGACLLVSTRWRWRRGSPTNGRHRSRRWLPQHLQPQGPLNPTGRRRLNQPIYTAPSCWRAWTPSTFPITKITWRIKTESIPSPKTL